MLTKKDLVLIFLAIIPILLQFFTPPEEATVQSLLYLGIIIFVFIVAVVIFAVSEKLIKIDRNERRIAKLEELLNYKENIYKLDKRIGLLESKMDKRGYIDPQIVVIIIMFILLLLYLRSRGLLNF